MRDECLLRIYHLSLFLIPLSILQSQCLASLVYIPAPLSAKISPHERGRVVRAKLHSGAAAGIHGVHFLSQSIAHRHRDRLVWNYRVSYSTRERDGEQFRWIYFQQDFTIFGTIISLMRGEGKICVGHIHWWSRITSEVFSPEGNKRGETNGQTVIPLP